jgi:hypothetical protein
MDTRQANALDRTFVPPAIRKVGHELLDHQCWVLGRDILHEGNNLLTEHGFAQMRCPEGGLTQYELRHGLGKNAHVFLWGFGAFFGSEREGIFLARSGFTPLRTQGRIELHSKENLPFAEESSNVEVLLKGIAWFAKYEDWISLRMCEQYRLDTLEQFPRRTLRGCDLADRWRALASWIAEDPTHCKDHYFPGTKVGQVD